MTTITTITAQIDALTLSLADVPGRAPQDAQNAATLLNFTTANLYASRHGDTPKIMLRSLERRGVDPTEAEAVSRALGALALRLGAVLGRSQTCPVAAQEPILATRGDGRAR